LVPETLQQINNELNKYTDYKLDIVDPREIVLSKKNARYMDDKTFKILVSNIKNDKNLSSVPFCYKDNDKYYVLSGNHRIKASINANVEKILILYDERNEKKSKRTARQLSHNAITGNDDLTILKELFDSISDISDKEYAGLNDELVKQLEKIQFNVIKEPPVKFEAITLLFLPEEVDKIDKWLEEYSGIYKNDNIYLNRLEDYNTFKNTVIRSKKLNNIKNNALALIKALEDANSIYIERIKESHE